MKAPFLLVALMVHVVGAEAAMVHLECKGSRTWLSSKDKSEDKFDANWELTFDDKKNTVISLTRELQSECYEKDGSKVTVCGCQVTPMIISCESASVSGPGKDSAKVEAKTSFVINRYSGRLRGSHSITLPDEFIGTMFDGQCEKFTKGKF